MTTNATKDKKKKPVGAICHVHGEYVIHNGEIRHYNIQVRIGEQHVHLGPLYVVKNFLLNDALKKLDPKYKRFRTHYLDKIVYEDEAKQQRQLQSNTLTMGEEALQDYCQANNLPVNFDLYPDINELRAVVVMAKEDPDKFEIHQASIENQRAEKVMLSKELASLNPEPTQEELEEAF